jgi:hypothetical protein
METLLILLLLIIVLDIASVRWGFDSTEQMDSPEWERRTTWYVLEGSDPQGMKRIRDREGL